MPFHCKLKAGRLQLGAVSHGYNGLSKQGWRWLFHAIYAELQVRYLCAKGANLLADFVKGFGQLRAEWARTTLQLCINDLHEEHYQIKPIQKGFDALHLASLKQCNQAHKLPDFSRVLLPEDQGHVNFCVHAMSTTQFALSKFTCYSNCRNEELPTMTRTTGSCSAHQPNPYFCNMKGLLCQKVLACAAQEHCNS